MNQQNTDTGNEPRKRDPDMVGAEAAMKRAAAKARERAWRAGSGVAVWKDGAVVIEYPEPPAERS